ncbi:MULTISPECIES: DUF5789 family protein [Haloferax]|uniref:Uncharacterized protein n=2 Tax=Haloferax TaxID=2251 RepID=A0A1H7GQK8_HALLR|nr:MULTISPECIES: DUF5789 family protein [Haloferax]ELZ74313.1 hypothetical protein C455_17731 [Haloferax larsenii JCM 13917]ELZ86635.1 hypothetical protein C453_05839 [Haloferax elongans ATCC BAA-1513]UVE48932.1 hypothetical protein KU306_08230 [Haloferax larsenii]SEK39797.1 hypothetical protein SAMN04488691_101358 [Haloferax larsenii]
MADEEADEEPVVELGEGESVEGAPLARVASRLTWPQEKSSILNKEGDAVIRTPSGPQTLEAILEDADETYFDTRQTFVEDVLDIVGREPVATE